MSILNGDTSNMIKMQRLESLLHVSLFRLESANLQLPPYVARMPDPNWILQLKGAKEWDGIIALYKDKLAMLTAMFPICALSFGPVLTGRHFTTSPRGRGARVCPRCLPGWLYINWRPLLVDDTWVLNP